MVQPITRNLISTVITLTTLGECPIESTETTKQCNEALFPIGTFREGLDLRDLSSNIGGCGLQILNININFLNGYLRDKITIYTNKLKSYYFISCVNDIERMTLDTLNTVS